MRLRDRRSIVGIDPTPKGIAFAFFEDGILLDWATVKGPPDVISQIEILDRIADGCAADVVILEDPDAAGCKRKPRIKHLLRQLASHARRRGIQVGKVSRASVHEAWADRGLTTKEASASAIAEILPELRDLVPPKRKLGRNEAERVNTFDAASLVLHYDDALLRELLP